MSNGGEETDDVVVDRSCISCDNVALPRHKSVVRAVDRFIIAGKFSSRCIDSCSFCIDSCSFCIDSF